MDCKPALSHLVSLRTLLLWRVSAVAFFAAYIAWRLILYGAIRYFYILIGFNFILDFFYFANGIVLLLRPNCPYTNLLNRNLFASVQSIGWVNSIIFWIFLSGTWGSLESTAKMFDMIVSQLFNVLIPVIDFALGTTVITWSHLWSPWIIFLIYCGVGIKIHYSDPKTYGWPYIFLDWINPNPGETNWPAMVLMMLSILAFMAAIHAFILFSCYIRDLKLGQKEVVALDLEYTLFHGLAS
jgi:hypothetical protein